MPEPSHTPFAGLIRIPPGQSLGANGFELQYIDPAIVDRLLKAGAVSHRHDGAAAVPTPGAAPAFAVSAEGGSIAAGETIEAAYTLVDDEGGETLPSPIAAKLTAGTGTDPGKAPSAAPGGYTVGALLAGNYTYGVTITDGAGGESALSPLAQTVVDPGHEHAWVLISRLKLILEETGGHEWRLWRQQGGGAWNLIEHGVEETVHDDGTLVPDCTVEPPLVSSTHGTAKITLTVPDPAQPRATFFRLYATTTGSFGPVSLLGEFPIAEVGKALVFTALALSIGQPPPTTRAYPHANKINPNTDLLAFPWKGSVTKLAELPTEGNTDGDVREVTETHTIYIWNGTSKEWVLAAKEVSVSTGYAIPGPIPTGVQPGIYIHKAELGRSRTRLLGVMGDIGVGENVVINVRRNGVVLAGYKEVTVTKAVIEHFETIELADKDKIDVEIVSNAGASERLSFTLFIGYY